MTPDRSPKAPEPSPAEASTSDLPAIGVEPAAPPPLPPAEEPAAPATEAAIGTHTPVAITTAKLLVVRGQRMDVQYPLFPGKNYLGRTDDKPVDIDLEDQESQDRIWTSRQHAVITLENGKLAIEDLNSLERHVCQSQSRPSRPAQGVAGRRRDPGRHRALEGARGIEFVGTEVRVLSDRPVLAGSRLHRYVFSCRKLCRVPHVGSN